MAKSPYLEEDCMKHHKPKLDNHGYNNNAKSLSFFASILSLFIYISIFYIFNLSPYTLLNNNIFWFFMSNTLIIIIAADYGAFSSSKKKQQDLYDEYVKHSQLAVRKNHVISPSLHVPKYDDQQQLVLKQCVISPKKGVGGGDHQLHEKKETIRPNSDMVLERHAGYAPADQIKSEIVPERVLEIVSQDEPKKKKLLRTESSNDENRKALQIPLQVDDGHDKGLFEESALMTSRTYRRSKSDRFHRAKRVVIDERRNKVRTMRAEDYNKVVEEKEEEENEFSGMSNEDLNKRVEEFIQKFNRQIRLQAAKNISVH